MADSKTAKANGESTVNSQIQDSVDQVREAVTGLGVSESQSQSLADQIMTQAVGLAMQNAVAQQQQTYVLRNAVTSAAAKAILESSPEEAIQLAKEALSGDDVVATLSGLKKLMDEVRGQASGAPPAADGSDEGGSKQESPKRSGKRS